MTESSRDTRCPHCGTGTGIERAGEPVLPGGLRPPEFEVLVRNEWRRRLGRGAYARAHQRRLVSTLTTLATHAADPGVALELADEVSQLIADLSAAGKGRCAIRQEAAVLVKAMRSVLRMSGVAPRAASEFVSNAAAALDGALGPAAGWFITSSRQEERAWRRGAFRSRDSRAPRETGSVSAGRCEGSQASSRRT